jgi:hypothetical protein
MIKIGDRVSLFDNISKTGEVIGMYRQKSNQWMSGGVMEPIFIVKIKLDVSNEIEEHRADKVMRID